MIRRSKTSDVPFPHTMKRRLRESAWWLLVVILAVVSPSGVRGQDTPEPANETLPTLARYVPDDVGLFVQIDRLREIGRRHRNRDVWWRLLQFAGGDESNWRKVLATSLGIESDEAVFRLFQYRVALAARDWHHLGDGVLMFVQPDVRMRRLLVRPGRARRASSSGPVEIYRSQSGLWIAIHDETIVLSQKRGRDTLFDRCVQLLAGDSRNALIDNDAFAQRATALPRQRDGFVFWTSVLPEADEESLTRWRPRLSDGALALRVLDDRVELELLGTSVDVDRAIGRGAAATGRVLALPQTTLAAWATTIDPRTFLETIRTTSPPPPIQRLWRTVDAHVDTTGFEQDVLDKLGSKCVFFLCADFSSSDLAPQFGFAIETTDSVAVMLGMRDLAQHVVDTYAQEAGEATESSVSMEEEEYLNTVIHSVHWPGPRRDGRGDTLAALVADNLTPAFAPVKGWMVFATSTGLVRDVVDASNGLSPRLGSVGGIADHVNQTHNSTKVAIIQPSFAQGTLRYWESILQERRRAYAGRTRLRVRVRTQPTPGQVIVANVDSNGPSAGKLLPEDGILACNDELLSLEDPNEHLKKLLSAAAPDVAIRLRVRRGDAISEVLIERHAEAASLTEPTMLGELLDKLAPLEVLASQVSAAAYCVEPADDGMFHARLTLEFEKRKPRGRVPANRKPAQ